MSPRIKAVEPVEGSEPERTGLYLEREPEPMEFIHSGCTLLDQILGGGWALGRVSNVYGDSATGKTLLGIEACANFARQFPNGKIFYRERESAFDPSFAETIGLPFDRVNFKSYEDGLDTIEDLFDDLTSCIKVLRTEKIPGFYCIDSLDAFSDDAEQEQKDIRESGQVAKKPRVMSQLFRQRIGEVARSRCHLMFISQIRTKIGVTYGRKTERAGGVALRFYASQIIFLRQTETIAPEIKGKKRPIGIYVNAKCEKNKTTNPYHDCDFPIWFNYGIDNLRACVEWLREVGELKKLLPDDWQKKGVEERYIKETHALNDQEFNQRMAEIDNAVRGTWSEIDELTRQRHLPPKRKYLV
jgi:recombination protein RecA